MSARVAEVAAILDDLAPRSIAEAWDRVGLQVGSIDEPVEGIVVALDPDEAAVQAAIDAKANLLIVHHPLIFRPLERVIYNEPAGKLLQNITARRLNVLVAHTNLDSAHGGINDTLAHALGLRNTSVLKSIDGVADRNVGLGRVGEFSAAKPLSELVTHVKQLLGIQSLRVVGNLNQSIQRLALCSGSGADFLHDARKAGAQCYITADVKYHQAHEARAHHLCLIDPGHFAMEQFAVAPLAERLRAALSRQKFSIAVHAHTQCQDPFRFC